MTPLIDVTFLLIIFFMIISNFISEQAVEMIVPELTESTARALESPRRVVVNVAPKPYNPGDRTDDPLAWSGQAHWVEVDARRFDMGRLEEVTAALSLAFQNAPRDGDGNSLLEVLLRADAALQYDQVAPVLTAITGAGIDKVHIVSYLSGHGPDQQRAQP
jgi:biopolymer transport protein ExbD